TAARSEPGPASARVVTWNVEGTMRSPSASMSGTKRSRPNGLRAVRETGRDFHLRKRCNQDSAIRKNLQQGNQTDERPHRGGAGRGAAATRGGAGAGGGAPRPAAADDGVGLSPSRSVDLLGEGLRAGGEVGVAAVDRAHGVHARDREEACEARLAVGVEREAR